MESSFSVGYRDYVQRSLREALRGDGMVLCLALMNARTPDVPAIAAAAGYDAIYVDLEHTSTSLETAAMLCAAIMAVRSVRTPIGLMLQAAGEFKAMARLSAWSALVSIVSTLVLLLVLGPVASLGGILLGDLAILAGMRPLARKAKDELRQAPDA